MYSVIDYCVVVPSCDKLYESGLHDLTLTLSLLFSLGLTSIRFLVLSLWLIVVNLDENSPVFRRGLTSIRFLVPRLNLLPPDAAKPGC